MRAEIPGVVPAVMSQVSEHQLPHLYPRHTAVSDSTALPREKSTLQRTDTTDSQLFSLADLQLARGNTRRPSRSRPTSPIRKDRIPRPPSVEFDVHLEVPRPHIRVSALPKHLMWPLPIPLPNLGNTCYMNSVVQCLRQSPSLALALEQCQLNAESHPAAAAMLNFFRMSEGDPKEFLVTFKSEAAKYNDEFKDFTQADAHEFLRTFLSVVHNEMNTAPRAKLHIDDMGYVGKEDEETAFGMWRDQFACFDKSPIYDLFGGTTLGTCFCNSCENSSRTFEAFLDLSLPIGHEMPFGANLEAILQANFVEGKAEKMDGSNRIYCSRCKRLRSGSRCVVVRQWPKLLVLHLKRFDEYGKKNLVNVIYPETFMTGGEKSLRYSLYGVLMHSGTEMSGHYTSYVRVAFGEWYLCNDGAITPSRSVDVMQELEKAYILFYAEVPQVEPTFF
ncbi:cysteine peptidase, Clan CA, family C19,putative [Trypanosoma brucei gambiense DAL972]|uniref:Ubiquitin carboxyl-terminal hydrolase, putative n=1 Tax=Trypanosoma brucei gambiense (strain MHOM/CI/86/DAL972) TaxID=679716 RepID=C9ZZB5_TRYB9|nr:cysteine peptidase, Clan CA, family C19,putative [Trypanosoma brucei gambiense DAL972]CBH14764.1 cysteine peptidase, Clan CA, family C19,putative [Trypanosoma brucei gambiense DAL972]|eukprot:XP_011777030.1 cysteine peptidase, Clan CA, family C19,putative [Trypanosoma brucei gambiense DAL972]